MALTPDPAQRSARAVRAAGAALDTGDRRAARELVELAHDDLLSASELARKHQLDASLGYRDSPGASAVEALIKAAGELLPYDVESARSSYLEALVATIYHTSSVGLNGWTEIARGLRALLDRSKPLGTLDMMLDGLTTMIIDGHDVSVPILKAALWAYLSKDISPEDVLRGWQPGWYIASELWEYDSTFDIVERAVRVARQRGSLTVLPFALINQALLRTQFGELDQADSALQEGQDLLRSIGQPLVPFPGPILSAIRGTEYSGDSDGSHGFVSHYFSTLVLANGHGRFQDGIEAARQALDHDVLSRERIFPDVIETAIRCGEDELALRALRQLRTHTLASGADYGLGMLARCDALIENPSRAEPLYREALLRLERTRSRYQWARTHLLFGEWLRQEGRTRDAQQHLLIAHEALTTVGALAFAQRAKRELLAAGGKPRNQFGGHHAQEDPHTILTQREDQIARLAASGETNIQIAAQLFVSPSTVDYHLRKVFQKLGVNSRRSLVYALNSASR